MDYIFDIFYEEMFESMDRNGLQTRQSRRNVIDRLNSIISGGMGGQNLSSDECSRLAVLSAIDYHQRHKEQNGNVSKLYRTPVNIFCSLFYLNFSCSSIYSFCLL